VAGFQSTAAAFTFALPTSQLLVVVEVKRKRSDDIQNVLYET